MLLLALSLFAAAQAEAPAEAKPVAPKKICRVNNTTGSRLKSGKICRTAAEWAEEDAKRDANLNDSRLRGTGR